MGSILPRLGVSPTYRSAPRSRKLHVAMRLAIASILTALILAGSSTSAVAAPAGAHASKKSRCTKGGCAKRRARKLLAGRVLIRFTETGSIGNESSLDQRLHFCGDDTFVYDSVSYIPGVEPDLDQVIRVTGSWKVVKANMNSRGNRGSAKVRGTPDDGSGAIAVKITWNPGKAQLDGNDVIVDSSDLC